MKFSIIHPTRSRPEKSISTLNKWVDRCYNDEEIEVIISIDLDDPRYKDYCKGMFMHQYPVKIYPNIKITDNQNRSAVDAINNAAKIATGDILIVVSDDTDCSIHWDKILTDAIGQSKDFVMKTDDGIQKRIITMPILDRTYYERDGHI